MKEKCSKCGQEIQIQKGSRIKRLAKFIISAFLIYFLAKAPLMWFMTEILLVHYVLSGAVAGSVITLVNFIPSEFWIWRKKK